MISFSLPLFYFLSGLVFQNKRSFKKFFWRRFKNLYLPYLCCVLFDYIVSLLINYREIMLKDFLFSGFKSIIGLNILSNGYHFNVAVWFLAALFSVEIAFFVISKIHSVYLTFLISCVIGIFGTVLIHFYLPFAFSYIFQALPFLSLGYLIKNELLDYIRPYFFDRKKRCIILSLVGFLFLAVVFFTSQFNVETGLFRLYYGNYFWFYFNSIIGLMGICMISIGISKTVLLKSIFSFYGSNSLIILCVHYYFCRMIIPRIFVVLNLEGYLYNIYAEIISSIFVLLIMFIFIVAFNKTKAGLKKR